MYKRKQCGAKFLIKVKCDRGNKLVPYKEFPYQPLRQSILNLTKQDGFLVHVKSGGIGCNLTQILTLVMYLMVVYRSYSILNLQRKF